MMIAALLLLAFVPMIVAIIWIRNTEKINREKWLYIILVFLWGATMASTMALVVETTISAHIMNFFILSVVFAPIIEELLKPIALRLVKKEIKEIEDGLIYGVVAGLGFAATENLLYGIRFMDGGWILLISLFYLRTIGTGLLHASATALTGYGYSKKIIQKRSILTTIPFFLVAIGVHSLFNLFAFSALTINPIISLVIASLFAVSMMIWIRRKIIRLDLEKIDKREHATAKKV